MRDDAAVSSVVSAVLLFGLFSTAFALYAINTLPQWEADKERDHMDLVKERFDSLKGGLEASAGSTAPVDAAIPLDTPTVPLLQVASTTGKLGYVAGFTANATFASPSLFLIGGQSAGAPTCPIAGGGSNCPGTSTVSGVQSLTSLALGLATGSAPAATDVLGLRVAVTDANGQGATVEVAQVGATPASSLGCQSAGALRTGLQLGGVWTYTLRQCGVNAAITTAYKEDLGTDGLASAALASLTAPYNLTFSATGAAVTGTYSMAWIDSTGADQVAGAGASSSYAVNQVGGALQYTAYNQHYPAQTVSYEFGGVVRAQNDGQAVASGPDLQFLKTSSGGCLRWTLVHLTGAGGVSGQGQGTAIVTRQSTSEVLLSTTAATFTLGGPDAAAWRNYLADQQTLGGLPSATTVTASGNTTTLTLGGGLTWIVHLTLIDATVSVT